MAAVSASIYHQSSTKNSAPLSLKERAYQTFGGTDFLKLSVSFHLKVLYGLVHATNVSPALEEKVFAAVQEDFKNHIIPEKSSTSSDFPPIEDSDEEIKVSYGGGKLFLEAFLYRSHPGYANEVNGHGMFVTTDPSMMHRDIQYALRTPLQHFDDPVTMTARIAKQHLQRVNHNAYEAVLPQRAVRHLKQIKVTDVQFQHDSWKQAVADLLPTPPMSSFGNESVWLTQKLTSLDTYTVDEIQEIVFHLLKFYE